MAFTAQDVKTLRERTNCGMMDCKKALADADGDMERAIEILREKGLAKQAKKAGRIAAEGLVQAYVDEANNCGVVIEVNAETDFVAKNADFVKFVDDCAKTVAEKAPADVAALSECIISGGDQTVAATLTDKVLTIGENMTIRRFERYEGVTTSYVHGGGKIGVLVQFETDAETAATEGFKTYAKDVAMQIAAVNPAYLDPTEVPESEIEKEKAIQIEQLRNDPKNSNKPANILEKIVMGKMSKYYEEICLLNQTFVKDNSMSVQDYTDKVGRELGADITVVKFVRFEKGEGIQKREDDFAAEVAAMAGTPAEAPAAEAAAPAAAADYSVDEAVIDVLAALLTCCANTDAIVAVGQKLKALGADAVNAAIEKLAAKLGANALYVAAVKGAWANL